MADGETQVAEVSAELISVEEPSAEIAEAQRLIDRIGEFRLVRELGKGAMGTVFLAEHCSIGSKLAVKVLKPELASKPQLVKQFYDEARAVNRIGHPGIIRIFDLKQLSSAHYALVMEFLDGQPLTRLAQSRMPERAAANLAVQVCDALDAAHKVGVIHGDIKPDNIFVLRRGKRDVVKLLDFGATRLQPTVATVEPAGTRGFVVGTPAYMPVEQWQGSPDARSDVYALGAVIFRLVTGRTPYDWKGKKMVEIFRAHRDAPVTDPRALNPSLSDAVAEVIMRALAKAPEARFQTAAEFGTALRRASTKSGGRRKKSAAARSDSPNASYASATAFVSAACHRTAKQIDAFTLEEQRWSARYQACASTSGAQFQFVAGD